MKHCRKDAPAAAGSLRAMWLAWPIALAVVQASACGSSSQTSIAPSQQARCAVQGAVSPGTFRAEGGSGTLRVSTDRECTWTVQSEAAWLAIAGASSGQGEGSIQFTIAPNGEPASRAAPLILNDQRLGITQEGRPCELRLSSTHESLPPSGGQRTIRIDASSSQCTWSSNAGAPWITLLDGQSGSGNGEVVFEVPAASGPNRTGTLVVAGQTVTIEQGSGCSVATGVSTINVSASAGRAEVPVLAPPGCAWTAVSESNWITVIGGQNGSGNGTVVIHADAAVGPPRTGFLIVAGQRVTIEQGSGCTFAISVRSISASASGGEFEVPIAAPPGCAWTTGVQAEWIEISSGGAGSGPAVVKVSVKASDGPARTGTLTVAGTNVTVTQASGCRFAVEPLSHAAPAGGATSSVTVQTGAGCGWTAASETPWINLSRTSGAGPAQVPFVVGPNNGPQRSATFTVAGQAIAVSQVSPCSFALVPPVADYDANGGRLAVLVIVVGGCAWTAVSTADWITVESATGAGDGLVQFIVAPNAGAARSGVVKIAGLDFTVRQAAR